MGADGYESMAENGGAGWSPVGPNLSTIRNRSACAPPSQHRILACFVTFIPLVSALLKGQASEGAGPFQ